MHIVAVKQPSVIIPIVMSLAALATVLAHILIFGTAPRADEGATAHIWQILMAGQIPLVVFHAVKWLPGSPRTALPVLCGANRSRTRGGCSRILARMVRTGAPTLRALRVYVIAVALGASPFLIGLIRALSGRRDMRILWMAVATFLGASLAMAVGKPLSRKPIAVLARSVVALVTSTLLAAWTVTACRDNRAGAYCPWPGECRADGCWPAYNSRGDATAA
jgi:hypothetical protein